MKKLRLHWSDSIKNGRKNFGDWLSPIVCQHISGREIIHAKPNSADLLAIGSILQRLKNNFWNSKTIIWGSGFIEEQPRVKTIHQVNALRGKKSAYILKNAEPMAFGDPGLLADSLLPNYSETQKKYSLGIVCHYKDATPEIMSLISKKFVDVKFIDIFSEPFEFMKKINSCELVLSSSLHGLVTADAFGIPNAWLKLSDTLKGGNFKFEDYYSTFDIYPSPLNIEMLNLSTLSKIKDQYQRNNISAIKKELISSFPHSLYK